MARADNTCQGDWTRWSPEEVAAWISEELGLPQYAGRFLAVQVDGPTLYELTEEILKDALCIDNVLHRKKIVGHVKLRLGVMPSMSVAPPMSVVAPLADLWPAPGAGRPSYSMYSKPSNKQMRSAVGGATLSQPEISRSGSDLSDGGSTACPTAGTGRTGELGSADLGSVAISIPSSEFMAIPNLQEEEVTAVDTNSTITCTSELGARGLTGAAEGSPQPRELDPRRVYRGEGATARRAHRRTEITDELLKATFGIGTLPSPQLHLMKGALQIDDLIQAELRPARLSVAQSEGHGAQRPSRRSGAGSVIRATSPGVAASPGSSIQGSPRSPRFSGGPSSLCSSPLSPGSSCRAGSARPPQSPRSSRGGPGSPRSSQPRAVQRQTSASTLGGPSSPRAVQRQASASTLGGSSPRRQYFDLMGTSGAGATLLSSPRAPIARAGRDSCPFFGKLSWQGRPCESTAGLKYSRLPSDFSKLVPGSHMNGAARFSPGVEHYPSFLLDAKREY